MAEEIFDANNPNGANTNVNNPLAAMQPGEQVICEIKRHPIGLIGRYITTGILIVVALAGAVIAGPQLTSQTGNSSGAAILYGAVALLVIFALIFLLITTTIYWKNRWIITSDSITQVNQSGLFDTQMSQLSMANLQDIGVVQDGITANMFNYGVLRAETAGERSKFVFIYCPNPKYYARQILMARENFINASPETAKRGNDELAVPRPPSNGLNVG